MGRGRNGRYGQNWLAAESGGIMLRAELKARRRRGLSLSRFYHACFLYISRLNAYIITYIHTYLLLNYYKWSIIQVLTVI